jgi:plastocyanin
MHEPKICPPEDSDVLALRAIMTKKSFIKVSGLFLIAVAGCGSSDTKTVTPDAKPTAGPDAMVSAVVATMVACPATPDATVVTTGFAYTPETTTITLNQIVKFEMPSTHDINSGNKGFDTPLGGNKCFQFTKTGTHSFKCTPHNFTGKIIVN